MTENSSTTADIALGKAKASVAARKTPPWIGPAVVTAIFVVIAVLGLSLNLGAVTTLITVLLYAVVAQGWNILGGFGGYLHFGAALFIGSGAYTAALLNSGFEWGFWQTIIPAALVSIVVSLIIGVATLRLRSHYFAIFTLVLTFVATVVVKNTPAFGGAHGVYIDAPIDASGRSLALFVFFVLFAFAIVATVIAFLVQHSKFGYALRAISEDEPAARVLGIKTVPVKLQALIIGAALGGAAGAVFAFQTGYIEPAGAFDVGVALDIVLVCVIGGLATWIGPLIGAIIVVLLEQFLRVVVPTIDLFGMTFSAESNRLVLGVLLIVFALFARRGVMGMITKRRGRVVSV